MQRPGRVSTRTTGIAIIWAACLIAVAGCRQESSSNEDHDDDHEHAGHVIPAHKPKSFPDAVRRLRELNDQIAGVAARGEPAAPDNGALNIALDIANWLPEIAAESDMPRKPWDEVNGRSAALVADYRTILSGTAGDRLDPSLRDAGAVISDLEKLLAAADPQWFAVPEKRPDEPEPAPAATDVHGT